jgi:hypothetical protein
VVSAAGPSRPDLLKYVKMAGKGKVAGGEIADVGWTEGRQSR